jgi:hypothetical protein
MSTPAIRPVPINYLPDELQLPPVRPEYRREASKKKKKKEKKESVIIVTLSL